MNQKKIEQKITKFVVVTGRVARWLRNPELKTLNVSCTTKVAASNNLWEDLHYASVALRSAAGENLVINNFRESLGRKVDWSFYLPREHPDYAKITSSSKAYLGIMSQHPILVADSMTESNGRIFSIEDSWREFLNSLLSDTSVTVILSLLREEGLKNEKSLVASGPLSFLKIYHAIANYVEQGTLTSYLKVFSVLNEVLRRGGHYKNGALTTTLDWDHPCSTEYINIPLAEIPYLKKGLRVDKKMLDSPSLTLTVLKAVNAGTLWLEKDLGVHNGEQLYSNVCRGISLKDRGSCLIAHVNAGQIQEPSDWVEAWRDAMEFACAVFEIGAIRSAKIYRDPSTDKQVAVGITGFANFLSLVGASYQEFVTAFEKFLIKGRCILDSTPLDDHVWYIACGVQDAASIARQHEMRAAFTIEPTESCSFTHFDSKGFTLAPNIDPPVAIPGLGVVRRNSEAVGDQIYHHGPVECAEEVGEDVRRRLWECWQILFERTGLAHMASYEIRKKWTLSDLEQWFDGPLKTTYYRRLTLTSHLSKGRKIVTAREFCSTDKDYCEACGS